ncbi:lytic transglycosylase domain-containing protein [Nitrospirota bacterium]
MKFLLTEAIDFINNSTMSKIAVILLLLTMLLPATAGAELSYRAYASDVGHFTYDASSAYALVPDSFPIKEINMTYVDEELYPASCTDEHARFYEETFALMFRMGPQRGACSGEVVRWRTPTEGEACSSGEMHIRDLAEFDFTSLGEIALVNLKLQGYVMKPSAIRAVELHIKALSERIPDRFAIYLGRSTRYLPMMKNILREEGVPEDMAYLPLIESGFNNKAYSRSRASGQWQFIRGTGKRYGLKINFWVDERRDPVKSTRAAARYLRDLHDMFDSWSLAMAGYNAGENRIKRALKRTEGKDFWSLVSTNYIRRETKNYVPKFIAARLIAVEPEDYGFSNIGKELLT